LINKGKVRGFITETEVLYVFPEAEEYLDEYDKFFKIVFLCRRRNNNKVIGYIRCRIEKQKNQLSFVVILMLHVLKSI